MVKDHSNSERGNPLPPHGVLFSINSKCYFYHPIDRITHARPLLHQSWITGWNESTMSECSYHGATSCSEIGPMNGY